MMHRETEGGRVGAQWMRTGRNETPNKRLVLVAHAVEGRRR